MNLDTSLEHSMKINRSFLSYSTNSFYQLRQEVHDVGSSLKDVPLVVTAEGRYFREASIWPADKQISIELLCSDLPIDLEVKVLSFFCNLIEERKGLNWLYEFKDVEIGIDEMGLITIDGKVQNTGNAWWFGCNAAVQNCEAIGILIFSSSGELLAEDRIHFFFECIAPQATHQFTYVNSLSAWKLAPGQYRIELGMIREDLEWFGDKNNRPSRALTIKDIPNIGSLDHINIENNSKILALTFDGGSSDSCIDELLNALSSESVRCTMFLTGIFIEKFPELVLKLVSDGHEIANHTYHHPRLSFDYDPECLPRINEPLLIEEIVKTEQIFRSIAKKEMSRLWRAPFGGRNPRLNSWLARRGYNHIFWTFNSQDWTIGKPSNFTFSTADMTKKTITFLESPRVTGGEILLFHLASSDRKDPIPNAVVEIIRRAKKLGFDFSTIGEMLKRTGYSSVS